MTRPPASGIGVVIALDAEARAFRARPAQAERVIVCGIGERRAARAAESLIEAGAGALVSFGSAAGLAPGLRPGYVVVASAVAAGTGEIFETDPDWASRVRALCGDAVRCTGGVLAGADRVLTAASQKRALAEATGAIAADMESLAVARAAARAGVPVLVLRAISDAAADALPESSVRAVDAFGRVRLAALVVSLARRPADLPGLIRLGRGFRAALAALGRAARASGPDLGCRRAIHWPESGPVPGST